MKAYRNTGSVLPRLTCLLPAALFLCALVLPAIAVEREVKAAGRAHGVAAAKARDVALAEALREAVRQGAGVDVASVSRVTDFALDFDVVFTRAFGFVRRYEILTQGFLPNGDYLVEITAAVSDTDNFTDDEQLLTMLVKRRQSPRVAIVTEVSLNGISGGVDAAAVLREMALEHQFQVIDLDAADKANERRGDRDAIVGDAANAEARRRRVSLPYDFLVRGKVTVSAQGTRDIYGARMAAFGVTAELSAIGADTGETVAQVVLPAATVTSTVDGVDAAALDSVTRYLRGQVPDTKEASARSLCRKIVVNWMTELDLGRRIQVELKAATREEYEQLADGLRKRDGVAQVYPREFDQQLISRLEAESRLSTTELTDVALGVLKRFRLDQRTSGYILLVPATVAETPARIKPLPPTSDPGYPRWNWLLIVAGIVTVIVGLILLRRPTRAVRPA